MSKLLEEYLQTWEYYDFQEELQFPLYGNKRMKDNFLLSYKRGQKT
jgi:hypothetical protein